MKFKIQKFKFNDRSIHCQLKVSPILYLYYIVLCYKLNFAEPFHRMVGTHMKELILLHEKI